MYCFQHVESKFRLASSTVESHSCVTQLRPHPTFLAGDFSQQPSVSISRRPAWNNHPPDRACTLRRHFQQQPLLAAAALLHPDCYYLGQHCWLAATVPLAAAAGPCRLLLVVCRVNSNCGVYRIAPSVQVGRPPRVLHDRPPVGAPCCPPGGGGGGGGGPSVPPPRPSFGNRLKLLSIPTPPGALLKYSQYWSTASPVPYSNSTTRSS